MSGADAAYHAVAGVVRIRVDDRLAILATDQRRPPAHDLAALLGLTAAIESSPPSVPADRRAAMKTRIVEAAAQLRSPQEPTDFGSTPTP